MARLPGIVPSGCTGGLRGFPTTRPCTGGNLARVHSGHPADFPQPARRAIGAPEKQRALGAHSDAAVARLRNAARRAFGRTIEGFAECVAGGLTLELSGGVAVRLERVVGRLQSSRFLMLVRDEFLDSLAGDVADIHRAIRADGNVVRHLELAIVVTPAAELFDHRAIRPDDGKA